MSVGLATNSADLILKVLERGGPRIAGQSFGENGSICVLYEYKEGVSDPWKPSTNLNNKTQSASTNQNSKNALTSPPPVNKNVAVTEASTPSCKESLRNMDYLLDPRKSVSIEQLAAYVSS